MYTDCPGCQRQFHVYASQLSAAMGLVKCGYCGEKFNALDRLYDKPLARPDREPPVITEQEPPSEPEFFIPEEGLSVEPVPEPGELLRGAPESGTGTSVTATGGRFTQRPGQDGPGGGNSRSPKIPGTHKKDNSGRKPVTRPVPVTRFVSGTDEFSLSEALLEQPVQKPRLFNRLLWGIGTLLMVLFAVSQIFWFNRDEIMVRYPKTIPWFNQLCEQVSCTLIRHSDPSAIELLNRDVRKHMRYKNALLVNATMSNRSQTFQAFPVVQLNLFNTDGKLIAYRQFSPDEYLDDSINILRGMAPNVPVHFVLEVLDPAEGAVSFEFEFH